MQFFYLLIIHAFLEKDENPKTKIQKTFFFVFSFSFANLVFLCQNNVKKSFIRVKKHIFSLEDIMGVKMSRISC